MAFAWNVVLTLFVAAYVGILCQTTHTFFFGILPLFFEVHSLPFLSGIFSLSFGAHALDHQHFDIDNPP